MSGAQFVSCLQRIGYPAADQLDDHGFDWMFENAAVQPILEWFCDNIDSTNVIHTDELKEFQQLPKEDILEGQPLEEALQNLSMTDDDQMTDEKWEEEIRHLEDAVKFTEQRKELLVQQRNKLALHQTALVDRASRVDDVESVVKHEYKQALEQAQEDNRKMNTALSELMESIQQLMELYESIITTQRDMKTEKGKQAAVFLSQLDLHTYYAMEDKFGQQLKLFTRKQFFEGIADIASEGEASRYEFLEISRPENLLVRGETDEVNLDECKELQRLQSLYPKAKCQQINARVEEKSTQAACKHAEEKLQEMKQTPYPRDISDLSDRLQDTQNALAIVQRDLDTMANEEVPALIKDSASLQVTRILRGDYDLKIARQDYFTSNQDQLIDQLIVQRGRYELLMMAYEIEARGHRDTHKLVTVASMLLKHHLNAFTDRMRMMIDGASAASKHQRETIDSRDKFITSLHSMLEDPEVHDQKQLFLTYSGLEKNAGRISQEVTSLRASLSSTNSNQDDKLSLLESNLSACESMVYSGSTTNVGQPVLSPQPILDTLTQLEAMLKKLEQAVMDVIKDVEHKKKLLKTDPLQNTERELFVYFFNDQDRLRRTLEDLNNRLKALE